MYKKVIIMFKIRDWLYVYEVFYGNKVNYVLLFRILNLELVKNCKIL